jgi:hypothetical protein
LPKLWKRKSKKKSMPHVEEQVEQEVVVSVGKRKKKSKPRLKML